MKKRIPKYLSSKWIKDLNKDDLYMRDHLNVEFLSKKYKVYLERFERDCFWDLLPHAILYVYDEDEKYQVCRIGYNFDYKKVTWTTHITEAA
jgi:hypothetical protein